MNCIIVELVVFVEIFSFCYYSIRLRALSDGGPNVPAPTATSSIAPPKYKLAEYRYGREEMLALYDRDSKPPESLKEFAQIYVEKSQIPLAMIPMTEEEQRLWSRSVNSDLVLRLMGKSGGTSGSGAGGTGLHDREKINERGGGSIRGGRIGGIAERGRGRGRGGFYQRGMSYEEENDSPPERFKRFDYERSTSVSEDNREKRFDRGFARGNDDVFGGRKNNLRSSSVENWRTGGRGEDREGWRTAGRNEETWNRGGSWRAGDRDYDESEGIQRNGPHRKSYTSYSKDKNDFWDDAEDDERRNSLPEWSLDDEEGNAKVGTFDDSGAFRETNLEDDDENQNEDEEDFKNDKNDDKSIQKDKSNPDKKLRESSKEENSLKNDNENHKENTETMNNKLAESRQTNSINSHNSGASNFEEKHSNSEQITKSYFEEERFSHLEKEAENMVAQWTADEEQKPDFIIYPLHHEHAYKWFYRDPQNEIQGPFSPQEMFEWYNGGYFCNELLVRRGCDEIFCQLIDLVNLWGRIPFMPFPNHPTPLNSSSFKELSQETHNQTRHPIQVHNPHPHLQFQQQHHPQQNRLPVQQISSVPSSMSHHQPPLQPPHQDMHQHQHQQIQHQTQEQLQLQLRLLLAELKKTAGFTELSQQQQQEILVQRYMQKCNRNEERERHHHISIRDNEEHLNLDALANLRIQGRPIAMMANNVPGVVPPVVPNLWELNHQHQQHHGMMSVTDIEEMQRKEQERKEQEEKRKMFEEEQRRRMEQEVIERKLREERKKFEELHRKMEEDRIRNQELLRIQEEERRKREDEERLRIRQEEERRRLEEEMRIIEDRRRQEEMIRIEEMERRRQQQEEMERRRRAEIEVEKERQRQVKMQQEQMLQEHEKLRQIQQEQEKIRQLQQQEAMKKMQHKAWGGGEPTQKQGQNALSLSEIQRLQEEKEREEKQRQIKLQNEQMQALFHAQQQQQKQQSTWATAYQQQNAPVKTLAEIQKEEAEKLAKQKLLEQKHQQTKGNTVVPNAGIWNNATSQLFGQNAAKQASANNNNNSNINQTPIGFWEPETRKTNSNRANDSALTSQSNNKSNNSSQQTSNKSNKNKKEEVKMFI